MVLGVRDAESERAQDNAPRYRLTAPAFERNDRHRLGIICSHLVSATDAELSLWRLEALPNSPKRDKPAQLVRFDSDTSVVVPTGLVTPLISMTEMVLCVRPK